MTYESINHDGDLEPLDALGINEAAAEEALAQLKAIHADEDDRRKTADSKISSAQNALAFTVTLAGGSAVFAFLQTPQYDLWHLLSLACLVAAVFLFVLAAWKITAASEPRKYQMRYAPAVRRLVRHQHTRVEILVDAINDLVSNIQANIGETNSRLTLYMEGSSLIRGAIVLLALVPLVIFAGYLTNLAGGSKLPGFLRITSAPTPAASASASLGSATSASAVRKATTTARSVHWKH